MGFLASNCCFVIVPRPAGSVSACLTRINKQAPGKVTWAASLCSQYSAAQRAAQLADEMLAGEPPAPGGAGKARNPVVGGGGVGPEAVCALGDWSAC